MLVSDAFQKLSFGVLSNLSLSNSGDGTIRDADKNKIIGYMDDALRDLYTRFNIREREVLINQLEWVTTYHLDSRYAQENPSRPALNPAYILDLPSEKFEDDALNILIVRDETGCELPINDSSSARSVFTPQPTALNIPYPEDGKPLSVTYQACHPKLQYGVTNAEIYIPNALITAFFDLVGFYVYRDMNTAETTAKAQGLFASYDNACTKVEGKNQADTTSISNDTKFFKRGFI